MTIYNFSAGPAVLPKEVLQQAQAEMLDWHGSGMSVMEMSHRGKEYMGIQAQAEADLRELMGIPVRIGDLGRAGPFLHEQRRGLHPRREPAHSARGGHHQQLRQPPEDQ